MESSHSALGGMPQRPAHVVSTPSPIREAGLALREAFSTSQGADAQGDAAFGESSASRPRVDRHETMRRADSFGSGLGFACAIHCAAAPLLLAAAPAVGLGWLLDPRVEQVVVAIVCLIAASSAVAHARSGRAYWLSGSMLGLASVLALSLLGFLPASSQESLTLACAFGLAGLHLYAARELDRKAMSRQRSAAAVAPQPCDCPEPCGP